jgi:transcriptional regulator with XRE-family HTH domain
MTGDGINERMDRLVKARWLAIGLSQTDLAEVLDTFQQVQKDGSNEVDAGRLIQVAEALDIPVDSIHSSTVRTRQEEQALPAKTLGSLQSLLALRLLRAFQELTDQRTKEVLVQLAEKIVKRQANRSGDAG